MAMNTSSKYDNINYKTVQIQSGPPSVYQLITKPGQIGIIRKLTLGEKDPTRRNKTILLVGETGSGKSTLINFLINYAMGVEFEQDVWYQIVQDEKKSQSESQTSDVTVYEVFGLEDTSLPFSLTIIDTPGFGHTEGTEQDVRVSEKLLDLFRSRDGVHEIDAVCLVVKATDCRLSDHLKYVFDSVVSLFGKDIERNIVALITNSQFFNPDNVLDALKDAHIMCAKDKDNQPVHFLFNNAQKTEKNKKNEPALKYAWDSTKEQMSQFADFLESTKPQDLTTTVEVLNARIRLKACIHNLQERIEFIEKKQRVIQQTHEALKIQEQDMTDNKDFEVEFDEVFKCKVAISEKRWWALGLNYGGAICCEVCKENCHHPCTLAWYPKHCEVLQNKCTECNIKCKVPGHKKELYCTVCTGKCHVSKHVKEKQCTECEAECSDPTHQKTPWKYVSKTRKVKTTIQEMKNMYEKGKKESEKKTSLLETLQENIEDLQEEKDQWLEESFGHVVKLDKTALQVHSMSTQVHLDFLIKKMNEKRDTEKVKKLEEMQSKMEKDKIVHHKRRYVPSIEFDNPFTF
ncbi:uncharacterized protein LOC117550999 [Gymnodraco acuticeps]|uniref:Uncharacterized protein LOC117550999 n=1 Tax=Gymnodraco acuticeps TaxID=8218 RepID=A0A6P8VUM7_GYMAC|nr:uncharacterized protein LOC117550999 [Gymnodraco acuticeps]